MQKQSDKTRENQVGTDVVEQKKTDINDITEDSEGSEGNNSNTDDTGNNAQEVEQNDQDNSSTTIKGQDDNSNADDDNSNADTENKNKAGGEDSDKKTSKDKETKDQDKSSTTNTDDQEKTLYQKDNELKKRKQAKDSAYKKLKTSKEGTKLDDILIKIKKIKVSNEGTEAIKNKIKAIKDQYLKPFNKAVTLDEKAVKTSEEALEKANKAKKDLPENANEEQNEAADKAITKAQEAHKKNEETLSKSKAILETKTGDMEKEPMSDEDRKKHDKNEKELTDNYCKERRAHAKAYLYNMPIKIGRAIKNNPLRVVAALTLVLATLAFAGPAMGIAFLGAIGSTPSVVTGLIFLGASAMCTVLDYRKSDKQDTTALQTNKDAQQPTSSGNITDKNTANPEVPQAEPKTKPKTTPEAINTNT